MTMKKKMASHQDGLELLLRASLPSPLFILYCVQAFFFFFFYLVPFLLLYIPQQGVGMGNNVRDIFTSY